MTHLKILFFKSSVNSKSLNRRHILMLSLPPLSEFQHFKDSTRQKSDRLVAQFQYEFFHQNTIRNKCVAVSHQIHFTFTTYFTFSSSLSVQYSLVCPTDTTALKCQMNCCYCQPQKLLWKSSAEESITKTRNLSTLLSIKLS